jgi:hypothetical protein
MAKKDVFKEGFDRQETNCCILYNTLVYDEDKKIPRLFVNLSSKNGDISRGCEANTEAIVRLIHLNFKHKIPVDETINQLKQVNCKACFRLKGREVERKNPKVADIPFSCADAIAKSLVKFKERGAFD